MWATKLLPIAKYLVIPLIMLVLYFYGIAVGKHEAELGYHKEKVALYEQLEARRKEQYEVERAWLNTEAEVKVVYKDRWKVVHEKLDEDTSRSKCVASDEWVRAFNSATEATNR